jgi:hypothetical protein
MNWFQLLAAVFGGSFFGSFLGPVLLDTWKSHQRKRSWVEPREKLIRELFRESNAPVISLNDICVASGTNQVEAREVLVGLGARGTTMSNGLEGWYVDRHRVIFTNTNIDHSDSKS